MDNYFVAGSSHTKKRHSLCKESTAHKINAKKPTHTHTHIDTMEVIPFEALASAASNHFDSSAYLINACSENAKRKPALVI